MPTPAVILAFSNDIDRPLSSLAREYRTLTQTLSVLEDRRMLRLFRETKCSTDDLLALLARLGAGENDYQLVIFHYGGHADGESLHLEDGPGGAAGLARLLGGLGSELALVFLNGCSTRAQVDALLAAGVRAVIATSAAIDDDQASAFAEYFYRKLASRASIDQAFEFAADSLAFKGHTRPQKTAVDRTRGLALREEGPAVLPWGLYYDAQNPAVLEWRFRPTEEASVSRPDTGNAFRANDYLLDVAWAMGEYKPEIREAIETQTLSEGEQFELVIKNFPWLISTQLRILLSGTEKMAQPTVERLEQIVCTYVATGQLMYFILLSNLWDQKINNKLGRIGLDWQDTVALSHDNFRSFDFLAHARQLLAELTSQPDATVFVDELRRLEASLQARDAFYNAYLYLESKREQLLDARRETLVQPLEATCADAEYALSVILIEFAFLIQYQMVTVRDVKLSKIRYEPPHYKHFIGKLHAHLESSIIVSDLPKTFDQFMDDRSVILMKNPDQCDPFLSLTPFVIDRNAYGEKRDSASNLCNLTFSARPAGETDEQYYYLVSSKSPLTYDIVNPNEAHLLHTGQKKQLDPANRRPIVRPVDDLYPFAVLRAQLEQFKTDWQRS